MESQRDSDFKPIVSSALFTHQPGFRELFPGILRVLLAHGEAYTPDTVSLGEAYGFRKIPFNQEQHDSLFQKWKNEEPGRATWIFGRESTAGLIVLLADDQSDYGTVSVSLQREYLARDGKPEEFLSVLKKLYGLLRPMYGMAFVGEMFKGISSQRRKQPAGMDLKRGIPDIFWANFLGPEYVEMFGVDKVFSAPSYSVEGLQDGGALMLLSASPQEYLRAQELFDRRRLEIKNHLGSEAFNTGEESHQVRIPKFRYEEDWKAEQARILALPRKVDLLASIPRREWEDWIENNEAIALAFISDLKLEGFASDYSKNSLEDLDTYIEALGKRQRELSIDLIKKIAAYVTQIVIRETGAKWSYPQTEDIPSVKVGRVIITPLARTLKVLEEGEKFGPWYNTITKVISRVEVGTHAGKKFPAA
ncbi:MAG TPA: hypothetical protein VGS11_11225 [Candidatus Bathyarchaeia archaeon]|nr:hypothetical protein [Candidatus Bathyarchaeia archaeon]